MKLIICKGLPGCGKSTFAKKWAKEKPKERVRVCRDDIRNMLGEYWVPSRESLVTFMENDLIHKALTNDYDVIVDATNLRGTQRFEALCSLIPSEVTLKVKDFTDVPIETCIERDSKRTEGKVGEEVIMRMYNKYLHNGS